MGAPTWWTASFSDKPIVSALSLMGYRVACLKSCPFRFVRFWYSVSYISISILSFPLIAAYVAGSKMLSSPIAHAAAGLWRGRVPTLQMHREIAMAPILQILRLFA